MFGVSFDLGDPLSTHGPKWGHLDSFCGDYSTLYLHGSKCGFFTTLAFWATIIL